MTRMVAMEELRFTGRSQSDPGRASEKRRNTLKKKFLLTIAPRARVCHEIASPRDVVENEMHLKNGRSFVFHSRDSTHRVDIAIKTLKKTCVSERFIVRKPMKNKCSDGLGDEVLGHTKCAPGGKSTRSLVYTRHISRYVKIIIN